MRHHPASHETLTLSDFDFSFPPALVAQTPRVERDQGKLLYRSARGEISHHMFRELPELLNPNTLLLINNTKVFPSRLYGQLPTGGASEIFLLAPTGTAPNRWYALGRPLRKLNPGARVIFTPDSYGIVIAKHQLSDDTSQIELDVYFPRDDIFEWLDIYGRLPLPPYIKRDLKNPTSNDDRQGYQTIHAEHLGSVAAPTAGLHFTANTFAKLRSSGVQVEPVTLHVGAGTFLPVKCEDLSKHVMHFETYSIPKNTLESIEIAHALGHPIIAVGTTTLRAIESFYKTAQTTGKTPADLTDQLLTTNLFISPKHREDRYKPKVITGIMTNFHQPKSTLFMLVSALIGLDQAKALYSEAFLNHYMLFSYGDTSLLHFDS
jgi:S-adenosylmethionine:tRNA ribosyltransferase-isomerase